MANVVAIADKMEVKPDTVAIHLRAGDVTYSFRRFNTYLSRKAVPYQLAAALMARYRDKGQDVIIFGQHEHRLFDGFSLFD